MVIFARQSLLVRGQERLSVFFVEDALINFTGDFTPTSEVDQSNTI
jgi:sulfur relay (sulfurtransferase) complex TusBCD TusD component (DsrE family)|tara:strand:+ start:4261 stop:4398 length:138 start_codon:yes stop_codon:yes gene_type:complete